MFQEKAQIDNPLISVSFHQAQNDLIADISQVRTNSNRSFAQLMSRDILDHRSRDNNFITSMVYVRWID